MPHADTLYLSYQVGTTMNRAAQMGILTDAMVAASTTIAQLKELIRAVKVHADMEYWKIEFIRSLDYAVDITLGSITTVAQLVAQTQAGTSTATAVLE